MFKNVDKKELNNCIHGVIGFGLYIFMSMMTTVPFKIFKIDYNNLSLAIKQLYLLSYQLITMILFILLYRHSLKKELIDFKENFKPYIKKYIKYWFISLGVMYVSNIIILALKYKMTGDIGIAGNEESIRQTLELAPIYTYLSAVIYAPFVEELTFRKSLRYIFKNDYLFIIISGLVFGGMHVFNAGMTWFDLLYLIPYCAPGVAFAYILTKSKNIFNTIFIHFLHNFILMTLQLIVLFR